MTKLQEAGEFSPGERRHRQKICDTVQERRHIASPPEDQIQPQLIQEGCANEYEVKYIHRHCLHYKTSEYYVKWTGYSPKEITWEPVSNLPNTHGAKQQYLDRKAGKKGSSGRERDDVTNDKLFLTMLMKESQLQDLNPSTLWAVSLQAQPPVFFWA
ncbi:hypothetical protein DSO57_1023454 [Entomophthora muscae]|uniref:Uncharacterized protein n=1 Tax=Entomophthora muscae TaxID=34485 RepID=A0ACC2S4W2_9FUNG|nr:hypothetical protein DSO57_1023454 [Entomophthora muscae]